MSKNTNPKPLRNETVLAAAVADYKTDTIKDTLKYETNAITLAVEIDGVIDTFVDLLGCEEGCLGLSTGMISNHLFQLRRLKSLFLATAIENGEDIAPSLMENANLVR